MLRALCITVVLLSCALLIACGDDDDDRDDAESAAPTDASPTEQASAPDETDEVTGTPPAAGAEVTATLSEYRIVISADTAPPGEITFNIGNAGTEQHVLGVVDTDLDPDDLPTTDAGVFDPAGGDATLLANTPGVSAGTASALGVDLEAGNYVLICTLQTADGQGHYGLGMHTSFTVE
jgi:hypothetical protein